ncbi:MAG: cupin domain-containing protein [Bacteroidia bacterium]
MLSRAAQWIQQLNLQPHPEGGFFSESYRAAESVPAEALPRRYAGKRCFSTAIYFLITSDKPSHFHKVASDEGWHFYDGAPVRLHMISPKGEYATVLVGCNPDQNILPQCVVPAGYWFAAEVSEPDSFSLVGCTVAPGFDFEDFVLGKKESLAASFPDQKDIINRFSS